MQISEDTNVFQIEPKEKDQSFMLIDYINNNNNNNNNTFILMKEVLQSHMSYRLFTPHLHIKQLHVKLYLSSSSTYQYRPFKHYSYIPKYLNLCIIHKQENEKIYFCLCTHSARKINLVHKYIAKVKKIKYNIFYLTLKF